MNLNNLTSSKLSHPTARQHYMALLEITPDHIDTDFTAYTICLADKVCNFTYQALRDRLGTLAEAIFWWELESIFDLRITNRGK